MANCPYGIITYNIDPGDSLWKIAQKYSTTVNDIMELNPGINAYNLWVGMTIRVCPGYPIYTQNNTQQGTMPQTRTQPNGTTPTPQTRTPNGTTPTPQNMAPSWVPEDRYRYRY